MTDAMEMRDRERMLRVVAALLILLLGAYQLAIVIQFYEQVRWPENQAAAGFFVKNPWPSVTKISERAATAGLRDGDKLLAVQGQPYLGEASRSAVLDKLFPADRIVVRVAGDDGLVRDVSWQLDGGSRESNLRNIAFIGLMTIGMPILCLIVGFWTVLARPADHQAWLLLGMATTFSHSVVHPGFLPVSWGLLRPVFHELHAVMNACWPLFMFLFAWEFPRRTEWQQRYQWLCWLALAILGVCVAVVEALSLANSWGDPAVWASAIDRLNGLTGTVQFLQMTAISAFFALLSYKRFALRDPDTKRRMQTILTGAALSLTPLFLVVLYSIARGRSNTDAVSPWVIALALMAMCIFPLTLAYVIIVHRAFGVAVVVRQGLQYALASRGVRILQLLLILGVMLTAVIMASQPGLNRPRILQVVAIGAVVVLALQKAAERLSRWVDRRFFREAYHAEAVLASLSDDVRTMVETRPLLEAVATRISEALHVDRIALLLRDGGQFQPAYAMGCIDGAGGPLPVSSRTAEVLGRERSPLRVYLDDTNSWVYREGLPNEETKWLSVTGAELLLPLAVKDRLLGFVSMGRKRSEEPYTGNDLKLLQSVAVQTGLALENSQLAAAITDAVAQRERLNREVEIAQEVQERLFPQNLPEIVGIDYWGYCRPARGVGGDSYDFLQLESNVFAISIGDVSGKGIPASLLMASLQSALRGQAMSMPVDLGAMMGTLNRLIFDSSPSNRYATLFYGQYDPATRLMTYVNGGHCPPMIVRGQQILRLEDGGPVVGLFRPARFAQGTVGIEPGDVLVGFTDGVSEAMNAADEEWGEDALGAFLIANSGSTARDLIPKVIAAADAFANGTPQHDDMTLIVVRFL